MSFGRSGQSETFRNELDLSMLCAWNNSTAEITSMIMTYTNIVQKSDTEAGLYLSNIVNLNQQIYCYLQRINKFS